jgi:hypothetical protein
MVACGQVIPMSRRVLLAAAALVAAALPVSAQSVSLTLREGRVTLVTQNATPAAILAEWSRLGQVKVVDAERVPGTPLTLRLENVPEREALDIVLRSAAGYIAAPRSQPVTGSLSRFDKVLVMATSPGAASATKMATAAPRPAAGAPVQHAPMPVEEEVAQAQPAVIEDGPAAAPAPEQPASSTNFDYANPQRYFAARQAEQQAAEQATQQQAAQPSTSPLGSLVQTSARPGVLPTPPTQGTPATNTATPPMNPYGLPAGPTPGSSTVPSTLEPDRAKYINPDSPTPPRP